MQHGDHPPPEGASPLEQPVMLAALWPSLCTEDRRALRGCCTAIRDAVDAQTGRLEGQAESPVLCPATCARLNGVHTLTLRTMACVRSMVVGAVLPRLQSLRLHLVSTSREARTICMHHACIRTPDLPCTSTMRLYPDLGRARLPCMHVCAAWDACLAFPLTTTTAALVAC
jgi:hypothetical protein